jgi:uncharacterized protein involved in outer membrane biogenesis
VARVSKVLGALLAAAAVLLIVGAGLALWLFDPNDYKGYAESWVETHTGRPLSVGDDLKLSFFPWVAVEAAHVTLGNPPGFQAEPFVSVERADVRVKLLPLLTGHVEIGTIVLEGARINLQRDAHQRGNWEGLVANATGNVAAGGEASPSKQLAIAGLRIRDGSLYWRDADGEVIYAVDDASIESGPVMLGEPIDLSTGFAVHDIAAQRTLDLRGRARVDLGEDGASAHDLDIEFHLAADRRDELAQGRLRIGSLAGAVGGALRASDASLDGRLASGVIGAEPVQVEAGWESASFDRRTQTLHIDRLATRLGDIEILWEVDGQSLLDGPQLAGSLQVSSAPVAEALELLSLRPPDGIEPAGLGNFDLTTAFSARPRSRSVELSGIEARLLGMTVRGQIDVSGQSLNGRIDVPEFAPNPAWQSVAEKILPAGVDPRALKRIALSAQVESDLGLRRMALRQVNASLLDATLTGDVEIEPGGDGEAIRGSIKTSRFPPDAFAAAFADILADPIDPRELGTLALDTRFAYDTNVGTLALDRLSVELFGLSAEGELAISSLSSSPAWSGRLSVQNFSPRDLFRRFGQRIPATSDPTALSRASIEARLEASSERSRFEDIALRLDDSRIGGRFAVEGARHPSYAFDLAIDQVDVDRYLAPPAAEAEAGEATAGEIELPFKALETLKLQGNVSAENVHLAGMTFQDISTAVSVGDGRAALSSARARLYGGSFEGELTVDGRGREPGLSLAGKASALQLEPLIEALFKDKANLSGTGSFDLKLAGHGRKVIDNVNSAAGTLSFTLADGSIEGFNLGRSLCAVYNATQKLPAPAQAPKATRYQTIQGTAQVENGVAHSDELLARSSFMDVTGRGDLELASRRLDYQLEAKLTGSIGIRNCESMDGLIGDSVPVRIKGTVDAPDIAPDYSRIIEQRVKEELRKRLTERLLDRLQH